MPQDTTMVLAQVVTLILEASAQLKQSTAASLRGSGARHGQPLRAGQRLNSFASQHKITAC